MAVAVKSGRRPDPRRERQLHRLRASLDETKEGCVCERLERSDIQQEKKEYKHRAEGVMGADVPSKSTVRMQTCESVTNLRLSMLLAIVNAYLPIECIIPVSDLPQDTSPQDTARSRIPHGRARSDRACTAGMTR